MAVRGGRPTPAWARKSTSTSTRGRGTTRGKAPAGRIGTSAQQDEENTQPLATRPRRTIHATRNMDPALAQNLRPGFVAPNPHAVESTSLSGDDEDEMQEQQREQGLISGDEDYSDQEGVRGRHRVTSSGSRHMSSAAQESATPTPTTASRNPSSSTTDESPFMATAHSMPSTLTGFDALRGSLAHTTPSSPGVTSVPSMIQPLPSQLSAIMFPGAQSGTFSFMPPTATNTPHLDRAEQASRPVDAIQGAHAIPAPKRTAQDAFEADPDNERECEAEHARKRAITNAKRRRYKHYALDVSLHRVMKRTGSIAQAMFSTHDPYPDPLKQEDTNIRSRVRKEAALRVPLAYGLHLNPSFEERAKNRERTEYLLADSRFACADVDEGVGRFQNPLIRSIIEAVWYGHATSLGCCFHQYFNPIRHETIALVLTAIQHVLVMYRDTGRRVRRFFTAAQYKVYDDYLLALNQFDGSVMRGVWTQYRHHLFKQGLAHAGIEDEVSEKPVISLIPDDAIAREYARLAAQAHTFEVHVEPVQEEPEEPEGIECDELPDMLRAGEPECWGESGDDAESGGRPAL
uniref:Slu7 domain-containing protein n=1 Tax=Ganoderma boninense TaxID=34458 RepID=A0A5K1JY57_9APHY|nr:Slu7 domain-containing protein [Ganoderma boninense]